MNDKRHSHACGPVNYGGRDVFMVGRGKIRTATVYSDPVETFEVLDLANPTGWEIIDITIPGKNHELCYAGYSVLQFPLYKN